MRVAGTWNKQVWPGSNLVCRAVRVSALRQGRCRAHARTESPDTHAQQATCRACTKRPAQPTSSPCAPRV
eukprot:6660451-Alexandrium_andersonii.AAC.1